MRQTRLVGVSRIEPEVGTGAEVAREAKGGLGGHRTFAGQECNDVVGWHAQRHRQSVRAEAPGLKEIMPQPVTQMHGREAPGTLHVGEVDPASVKIITRNHLPRRHGLALEPAGVLAGC
jgi:hypothetical protein